ncbi:cyanophycin synthetase [Dyadobacter flavalbus]|uniref:Cyanophycin synthetase n=1 Tax=Dyadobacter flavalbus TaxID=2579942 RepID=A0A5M8QYQ3_9BACT|nr:cyanophycin synthetase [Dyadobacter flavalbus]KAA6439796.1 cyanophycin synthetase [Dyadobacter flavalbus]
MRVIEIRCLRGPNVWSVRRTKLVVMKLDLEEFEELPTNKIDGFYDRLKSALPGLYDHFCSEGHAGGFFERVKDGTWMGHVIEHIALELQTLAGMDCGYGRTRGTGTYGVYHVVIEYREERAGVYAAESAVALALALAFRQPFNIENTVEKLKSIYEEDRLGPSTQSIVSACEEKGIPYLRLNDDSYVQLGYGSLQKRIEATTTSLTSNIAVEIAGDKNRTKQVLSLAGIRVPAGEVIAAEHELMAALSELKFPLVIKPLDGNQGKGVTTNITSTEAAVNAFARAKAYSDDVIVEEYIEGMDYRLLVVDGKLVAAARRTPACVTGDGESTIRELINIVNSDPRRGDGHQNILTRIVVDNAVRSHLNSQGLSLDSVPLPGKQVMISTAANLSKGGTSEDVTDELHPDLARMAERIAKIVGLDICGIDLIAKDINQPVAASGAAVVEVNASPGFRMHLFPSSGKARNVGQHVADMLFPEPASARIPIIAVTGTNGKTTTSRIVAHLFRQTGACVGYTTTDGIYVDGQLIETGDCTGPESAKMILRDPTVDVAVLETARGGLLRSGLAFDKCNVGIVTNVAADHLGLNDIHTLEQMTNVKAVIAEAVKKDGYAILNADNDPSYGIRERLKCKTALFSMDPDNERIFEHTRNGGLACVYDNEKIKIIDGNEIIDVESVERVPATFGGKCHFMIENILGAVLAAYVEHVDVNSIAEGLRTFRISDDSTPGRLNHFHFRDFDFMIDYAHNPHGMSALGQYIETLPATSKLGIITGVGDRRDEDIEEMGKVAAGIFDEIIIRLDEDLRGRRHQDMINLIKKGIKRVNPICKIKIIKDELQAINFAIRHFKPGQLIVLMTDKVRNSISLVRGFKELEDQTVNYEQLATDFI